MVSTMATLFVACFSAEPAGGAAERHEAGRGSPPRDAGAHPARHAASPDVRAQHPVAPRQPGHHAHALGTAATSR